MASIGMWSRNMLIVGPLIVPNSAEDVLSRVREAFRSIEGSLLAATRTALNEEAKQCAQDVCVHCRPSAVAWLLPASFHAEMQQFYHMLKDNPERVGAQCDARGIWQRLYNVEIGERLARERRPFGHWPMGGDGAIAGKNLLHNAGGAVPQYAPNMTAAAPGIVPGSVANFKMEACQECCGAGKGRAMLNTKCPVCQGNGQVLVEQ